MRAIAIACFASGCSLVASPFNGMRFEDRIDASSIPDAGRPDAPDAFVQPLEVVLRWPPNGYSTGSALTAALDVPRNANRPRFIWEPTDGADEYEIELTTHCIPAEHRATCSFFDATPTTTSDTEWRPPGALAVADLGMLGSRYMWRVRACRARECGAWSEIRYLDVGRQSADNDTDGHADLALGAPSRSIVYVYTGPAFTGWGEFDYPSGDDPAARFGASLAWVGDVYDTGHSTLAVSAEGAGSVFLFGGGPPTRTLAAPEGATRFGAGVAGGDLDGNGYSDVVVGSADQVDGMSGAGRVYAYFFGELGVSVDSPIVIETPLAAPNGGFGVGEGVSRALSASGDLDGDGYVDLVVGAPREGLGRVYVYRGGPGFGSEPAIFYGTTPITGFGLAVTAADFDDDGFSDVLVASDRNLSIIRGGRALDRAIEPLSGPIQASYTSISAGDMDGDGAIDPIVAVHLDSGGESAFVLFGGGGSFTTPVPLYERASDAIQLGALGDRDGDGDCDVAIASPATHSAIIVSVVGGTRDPDPVEVPGFVGSGESVGAR